MAVKEIRGLVAQLSCKATEKTIYLWILEQTTSVVHLAYIPLEVPEPAYDSLLALGMTAKVNGMSVLAAIDDSPTARHKHHLLIGLVLT